MIFEISYHTGDKKCKSTLPHTPEHKTTTKTFCEAVQMSKDLKKILYVNSTVSGARYVITNGEVHKMKIRSKLCTG